MSDTRDDQVELLDADGGPDDDMGEWIPTPDMENEARFFNDDVDPGDEDDPEVPGPLLDPFGGPDEPDPDLNSPTEQDLVGAMVHVRYLPLVVRFTTRLCANRQLF